MGRRSSDLPQGGTSLFPRVDLGLGGGHSVASVDQDLCEVHPLSLASADWSEQSDGDQQGLLCGVGEDLDFDVVVIGPFLQVAIEDVVVDEVDGLIAPADTTAGQHIGQDSSECQQRSLSGAGEVSPNVLGVDDFQSAEIPVLDESPAGT